MTRQIKSRERVENHGEVFTSEREVNAMLDLVKTETERIESRFLEPACGTGNFLTEILRRKLDVVAKQYKRSKADCEKYAVVALSSIYGVELLEDNVEECRERLYNQWDAFYTKFCGSECTEECREAARYILLKNILCGDALTMLRADGSPIIFSQWDLVVANKMKRRDYRLDSLMAEEDDGQMTLGTEHGTEGNMMYDDETHAWIPAPIREYELVNYWEIQDAAET